MLTSGPAFFLYMALATSFGASAAEPAEDTDSLVSAHALDELTVEAVRRGIRLDDSGSLTIDTKAMGKGIRMFGEADPLRYAKRAAGAQTGSDYSSGLSVQGTGYSHTLFRIGGAPIWFPYHFGGIFSTFNGSHYSRVRVEKSQHDASAPNRLGAVVDLYSPVKSPDRLRGEVNVGMTASSLSLNMPVTERFSVIASGRISYLDAVYGPVLDLKDQKIRYSFGDASLTGVWRPRDNDMIKLDALYNNDGLKVIDRHFQLDTYLDWENGAVSAQWSHRGERLPWKGSISWSGFRSRLTAIMPGYGIGVPSWIWSGHVNWECEAQLAGNRGKVRSGFEGVVYADAPQQAVDINTQEYGGEGRIYGNWEKKYESGLMLDLGIKASGFVGGAYATGLISPAVTVGYETDTDLLKVHSSLYPQYVHQVGFSEIGLASNFWYMARKESPAQLSWSVSASWQKRMLDGMLSFMMEPYYKKILHEPSYTGIVLDLIDSDYRLEPHLVPADGFNAGFEVSLYFRRGPLDVRGAYSLGYARRRFPSSSRKYLPSVNENLHNFNLEGALSLDRHWNLSANFVLSSGRPYTPIEQVYMIGENILTVYGDMNTARMPLYHRLDLGATYSFESAGRYPLRHYVNLSLINAYAHKNIEMSYYRFSSATGNFYLHRVSSLYRFVPSVSYTIEF